MEELYYIIHNGEGDTTVEAVNKEELLERVEEGYYGIDSTEYLDELPSNRDTNYWGGAVLIIKGTIVSPKPEEVVTKYKID